MKRNECLRSRLFKMAIRVNNKLQKLDYRHYSNSACSDINALTHSGYIEFKHAKPFLDFVKDLEKLLVVIFEGANDCNKN